MSYPVVCLKNGNFVKLFDAMNAAHDYVLEITKGTEISEDLWDVVNFGVDDHKSWNFQGDTYDFRTTKEAKDARANRKTRKAATN